MGHGSEDQKGQSYKVLKVKTPQTNDKCNELIDHCTKKDFTITALQYRNGGKGHSGKDNATPRHTNIGHSEEIKQSGNKIKKTSANSTNKHIIQKIPPPKNRTDHQKPETFCCYFRYDQQ